MTTKLERITPMLDAIEKAGGLHMDQGLLKELSYSERNKVAFSVWAFLFGIFYYFYHEMWKKGLTLLGIVIVIQIFLTLTVELIFPPFASVAWVVSSVIFATRAPINLYMTYRLDDDSWNPIKDLQNLL